MKFQAIKQWFTKKSNLLLVGVFAFLMWQRGPGIINNFEAEGMILPQKEFISIKPGAHGEGTLYPPAGRSLTIFWATWCSPCKVEMKRVKESVERNKISGNKVFAINPFENAIIVRNFLQETPYPFTFLDAPEIHRMLKVSATPTTAFINDGKLDTLSTGMSVIGIWKAESYLSDN